LAVKASLLQAQGFSDTSMSVRESGWVSNPGPGWITVNLACLSRAGRIQEAAWRP
jgi:hypothetical protein